MKLATWNVNSIRARLDHVLNWLESEQPDVLCMQETKVEDDDFPSDELQMLGYSVAMTGTPAYNGVAIASRLPMKEIQIGLFGAAPDAEPRLIAATLGGIRVLSAYIPNGRSIVSPAFAEKLAWLKQLRLTVQEREAGRDVFLGGDFNVASDERDLYDPEAFRGRVHFHPDERRELDELRALGLVDAFRKFDERPGQYSWWDSRGARQELPYGQRAPPPGQAVRSHSGHRRAGLSPVAGRAPQPATRARSAAPARAAARRRAQPTRAGSRQSTPARAPSLRRDARASRAPRTR